MNDMNEDESSGHFPEEETDENPPQKTVEVEKKQPVLTQNNQVMNKNDKTNVQKVSEEENIVDDDENKDQDDDKDDEMDPDFGEKDNDYDPLDDDDDKPGKNQQVQTVTYQSSKSKLLNIITKPGILAGIVGGAIIGVLTAILLIMFIVYRMRKKDEGSYALEETKKPLNAYDYRHCPTKEFYA